MRPPIKIPIVITGELINQIFREKTPQQGLTQLKKDWPRNEGMQIGNIISSGDNELSDKEIELALNSLGDEGKEILTKIFDQGEHGIWRFFLTQAYDLDRLDMEDKRGFTGSSEEIDLQYKEGILTLSSTTKDFEARNLDDGEQTKEPFGKGAVIQTISTYQKQKDGNVVPNYRELLTNSPILAAELYTAFLERNNPAAPSEPINKYALIYHISKNPEFLLEAEKNNYTYQQVREIAGNSALQNPANFMYFYCNKMISEANKFLPADKIRNKAIPSERMSSVAKITTTIPSAEKIIANKIAKKYREIMQLKPSTLSKIAKAMIKNPNYLEEVYFRQLEAIQFRFAKALQKVERSIKDIIDSDPDIKKYWEKIKAGYSSENIADMYLQKDTNAAFKEIVKNPELEAAKIQQDILMRRAYNQKNIAPNSKPKPQRP